jgi:hypothetical protein
VASGATAPGPALEGAPRFRPKIVLMSFSRIPIEIPILWPRAVMVSPRPRVLLIPPLDICIEHLCCTYAMLLVSFSYVALKMSLNFQFAMNMLNLKNELNLSHMFLVESTFYHLVRCTSTVFMSGVVEINVFSESSLD